MVAKQGHFSTLWEALPRLRGKLALLFLLLGLVTGAGLALLTPIGDVSDEPSHMARAAGLLNGEILGHREPIIGYMLTGAGVDVDSSMVQAGLSELFPTIHGAPLPRTARQLARAARWSGQNLYYPTQMVQYFPALYAPAALGLWLGRAIGVSPLRSLFLARLLMLASYLAMGFAALRLARFGQPVLFAVLMLPLSLSLGASFSQDGQLIAATVLAAALLTRAGPKPGLAWGVALALLALVACSKPPYAPLLGLCLLPLVRHGLWGRLCLAAAAAVLPLAWMRLMMRCCYANWVLSPYHPGPLWPGPRDVTLHMASVAYNLEVLRAHPAQILILPVKLLVKHGGELWWRMIGSLSWNSVVIPSWEIWGWGFALAAAVLATLAQPGPGARGREAVFVALLIIASYFGVALALYLSWTRVGDVQIVGVNGRYFLLFWPAVLFLLPRWRGCRALELLGLAPAVLMAVADVWALPAFSWQTYQMFGP